MTVPHRSGPMFVVGLAEGETAPQHQPTTRPAPSAPPFIAAAPAANTSTSTMNHQTPQERDAALLRELATSAVNKALLALNANLPTDASAALRTAQSFADRLATAHGALAVVNARKASEFHGYDLNEPMTGAGAEAYGIVGGYDLNNPEGE